MTPLEVLNILLVCEAIAIFIGTIIIITIVILEFIDICEYVVERYFPRLWYYD